jgi:hypothetical protein
MGHESTDISSVLLLTGEENQSWVLVPDVRDGDGFSRWEKGDHLELLIVFQSSFHILEAKMQAIDELFRRDRLVAALRLDQGDMALWNES